MHEKSERACRETPPLVDDSRRLDAYAAEQREMGLAEISERAY